MNVTRIRVYLTFMQLAPRHPSYATHSPERAVGSLRSFYA